MSLLSVEGGTLDQLQTTEQVALLDTIDELRSQGLGHHGISLPQLIVCGDQSSGKSSLLEGLTRLRFPTDATCTTIFATEVVLRRGTTVEISVEITPSKHRSDKECRALATFKHTYSSCEEFNFHSLHAEARTNMAGGKSVEDGTFFDDVLRVKYSGPDMPSFTIVDLPGLILRDIKGGDGVRKVADLVTRYMEDEKAIILAVMSAGADMENQHTLNYLDQHDPTRQRTLGIITKPDTAPRGSKLERAYVDLAKNEKMPMKYHWHTVRNRNHEERAHSDTQRDEAETKFFQTEPWASLPRQHVGIAALRAKLSRVLLEHISMELPSLATAVQNAAQVTESSLKALGHTRDSSKEQRAYLTGHAERFQMLTNDALRGIYSNRFFALTTPDEQAPIRLRTVVQNLNLGFAHVMYENGHTWDVVSDEDFKTYGPSHRTFQHDATWSGEPVLISRADFLEKHIGNYVRQSRPSGLPSLVNPWVIGEVFRQQSRNWSNIAKTHLQQVFQAVRIYVEEALSSLVDPRTHNLLMLRQIQPELDKRWHNVEAKLEELLVPYTEQDPITYDPGFLSDLERMRALRYNLNDGEPKAARNPFTFDKKTLGNTTSNSSQRLLTESLDDFTNSEILDLMQTYYKVGISPRACCMPEINSKAERNISFHQQHRSSGDRELFNQGSVRNLLTNSYSEYG
jgi:GTP-binding protein EngB required for normal cell division